MPQIDIAGQQKILDARVTIIGLGGLGCPAALYLAAAGVGQLNLIDHDVVELTNLQRQLAYTDQDIGQSKAALLATQAKKLNPNCRIEAIAHKFEPQRHTERVKDSTVLIDATDNLESRHTVNRFSRLHRIPLVFAAAIRMEGQLSVFDPRQSASPCFACIFGDVEANESCSQSGVLGTVVATMGLMQATETIKLITQTGQPPVGKLLLFDALTTQWQTIKLDRNPNCRVCGQTE